MADSKHSQGYKCNFFDSIPNYLYCKICDLVAKKISITTCCGESFCHVCISNYKKGGKPCPICGENDYNCVGHKKNQKEIASLQVYCSMKERGCDWSGTLEQLDTHLDPDQDNCQYVDTKCPLNCQMAIPKNKVEQHKAQHCVKRPYSCQYCSSFEGTYEEVVNEHFENCKYVPLRCTNMCGVTFERDFMEDHMKTCRLQEVKCEFSRVGCDDRFRREDQEEHIRQNSHKHLTLIASLAVENRKQIQEKLPEQDEKHKAEEEELKEKIQEQEQKIEEQEKKVEEKLQNQDQKIHQKLKEQEYKLVEREKQLNLVVEKQRKDIRELKQVVTMQEQKFHDEMEKLLKESQILKIELQQQRQEYEVEKIINAKKFENLQQEHGIKLNRLSRALALDHTFVMKNFSVEKAKDKFSEWKSSAMYTHVGGYKFCIGVDANGYGYGRGKSINVDLWSMPGEYDSRLKWPVKAKFTLELINQQGRENASYTTTCAWEEPTKEKLVITFKRRKYVLSVPTSSKTFDKRLEVPYYFLGHSDINNFLLNDTLCFNISEIKIL